MSQERKKILEMVQSGKLSAQEAIVLLEALENEVEQDPLTVDKSAEKASQQTWTEQSTSEHKQSTNDQSWTKEDTTEDSFYTHLENAGERVFDFVSNALNKLKDIELQFTQPIDVSHVFQQVDEQFDNIDIDVANGPVRLTAWDQSDVRVECEAKVYRVEDREEARRYFMENTIFSAKNGLLLFATQSKWMRVETTIYVPKKKYNQILIKIFNGELTGKQLSCERLNAKTTNGKIDLTRLNGNQLDIETVNGQIRLAESSSSYIDGETVNGAIDISGSYGNVDLKSFNGNVSCQLSQLGTTKFEAKVVTGNIALHVPEQSAIDGEVKTNLGNYALELGEIDVLHEKKEVIQKQVKFRRKGSSEIVMHVFADTKTGSVHIRKNTETGDL